MLNLIFKHKWYLIAVIILMILEPSVNSVLNFWLQNLFNSATVGAEKLLILRLLTKGFLLWILKRLVSYSMLVIRDRYICNIKQSVKHRMFKKLFSVSTSNISEDSSSGEVMSMFTNDIMLLEQRYLNQIMGLISSVFSIAILGYSFVTLNTKLAVAIIGFGVLSMFVPLVFSKNLNLKNMRYSKEISVFTQRLKEYIIAFPTIRNYSVETEIEQKFEFLNDDVEDAKFEADSSISLANNVGQLLAWFMQFIGVGLGLIFVLKGEIMVGTVIAAQSFANDIALPIQNMLISINSIRSVKSIVKKLENLAKENDIEEATDVSETPKSEADEGSDCGIFFDNVTLQLGAKKIVDNFTFKFESGKRYLIVGINGSGKSSVFKILKKWYKGYLGTITVNGIDIKKYSSTELSQIVSYLNENVSLFSGSVRDNILLYRNRDEHSLDKAVEDSHIELNLNKEIADEGRNISSGEQRRIEIARTLLSNASVLIFDEVVSTLDIETAYSIEKAALGFKDKTVIFISHNFSGKLIKHYDEIIVMDSGRIVAHGHYNELIETNEYFKRICDIKFGEIMGDSYGYNKYC